MSGRARRARGALVGRRRKGRKSGGRPQPAGGEGGRKRRSAEWVGTAARLKKATHFGNGGSAVMRGGRGKRAPRGPGAAAPGGAQTLRAERARGLGLLEAALGGRRLWRRRRSTAAGRPWPGAGRRRHHSPLLPSSFRPPSPPVSPSPSALLRREERRALLPCGRSARPVPRLRFPPRLGPGPKGACHTGPALGSRLLLEAPGFSQLSAEAAALPQRVKKTTGFPLAWSRSGGLVPERVCLRSRMALKVYF